MSASHIAELYFDGRKEAAKKRLQKLKSAALIKERPRRAFDPAVLFLARAGLRLLDQHGVLSSYPHIGLTALEKRARVSDLTIRHELEVMDVRVSFNSSIKKQPIFLIEEFCTWPLLHQFEATRPGYEGAEVVVKPDGFIRIHENEKDGGLSEHTFFLEVDRSSESLDTLVSRAGCYLDYYRSGGFAEKNGAPRGSYREYPFRVLMVFKTAERRNNIAERLLQQDQPILTQVCLSTLAEVTENPLGPIWIRPADYQKAIHGTAFAVEHRARQREYQRNTARELFVDQSVRKHAILGDASAR